MSRSKEAVYRESGEADYDEAGSPLHGADEEEPQETPVGAVTDLRRRRDRGAAATKFDPAPNSQSR